MPVNTNVLGVFVYTLDSVSFDNINYLAATGRTGSFISRTISIGTSSLGTGYFSACRNQIPFYWGSTKIDSAGTYSTVLKNSYSCDSFVTAAFSLISNKGTSISIDTICFSQFPYNKNGLIFTKPGTYYQTLINGVVSPYLCTSDSLTIYTKLNYTYKQLYSWGFGSNGHDNFGQKSFDISNDLMGNDMVIHSQGYGWFNRDYQYIETQSAVINRRPDVARRRFYDMLYTIKGILDSVNSSTILTIEKDKIKGQCLGLRAYCYYFLVNYYQQTYFGNTTLRGLPIIKEGLVPNNNYGTVQDIYNLILTDLTNAETLLTGKTFIDKSAFSISVVYGFRARIALLQNDWTNAATYANKAYTSVGATTLMTPTEYKEGFSKISNPEWLWGSYIDAANATIYASFFSHFDITTSGYAFFGTQKKITKDLYDKIPAGDVRKTVFQTAATATSTSPVYNQLKFRVRTAGTWNGDYVYMRTAEMYLIEAEAKARLGNDTGAKSVLETLVKSRYPAYSAASFSGATLIEEILLQRRIELWGEGFSLIDLKRTNAGLNRPTGTGNHGSPNFDPVVYNLPAGSPLMVWVTPTRDSGLIIPCEKVEKLILTKKIIKENQNVAVCSNQLPYNWNGTDYTTSGNYIYFTTTQDNSCDSLCTLNLSILNKPQISSLTYNNTLKPGDTLRLNVVATNATIYSWTGPSGFTSSTQNPAIPSATALNSGKYFVTIINGGCSLKDSIDVTVGKTLIVSGRCISPKKIAVPTVSIKLFGSIADANISTNSLGEFKTIIDSTKGGKVIIKPTKNNDVKKNNGVSSIDVILVQNHILNKIKLNSPYKIIAADVNNNKTISNIDIIFMKRLILGLDTSFTGNRLWSYVDSSYTFADTTNPFPYKDSIVLNNITTNKVNQTFICIKLGDVNYDWNPLLAKGNAIDNVELIANSELGLGNGVLRVPINVKNFKDLVAMQYTLNFNNKDYEFVGIENNKLGIEFNDNQQKLNGNISFLWNDKNAIEKTLEDGTEIFTLVFKARKLGTSNMKLGLALTNDITEIEAWDKNYLQHAIILTKREKPIVNTTVSNEQWSVNPNPTTGEITVNMQCKLNKSITINLTNAEGKTLYQQVFETISGNNVFKINLKKQHTLIAGVYYLKANGLNDVDVKKIVVKQ